MRLRLIPLTIIFASLFLMIKVVALIQGGQKLSESLLISRVEAEEKAAEKPKEEKSAEKPKEEKAKEEKSAEKPKEEKAKEEKPTDKPKEEKPKEEKVEDTGNPNVTKTPGDISDRRFTTVEVELLQKLSKRREELDVWEANLQIKETALNATEKRIDDKIAQVEAMKKAVSVALAEYNKIEDTEVASLVKIYENMKPADAARIFDELDRQILLLIVDRMSEKKASPILAAMDSKRAKMLTVDLAEQRRIKSNTMNAANTANAAATNAGTPATSATPAADKK